MLKMRETYETGEELRTAVQAVCQRLSEHCGKVRALVNGFEEKQFNDLEFLDLPFYSTRSSLTKAAIVSMVETYESLRRDVRDIIRENTEIGYVDFEVLFPKLDVNFETYYSVAVSLLNLTYQMQLMRIYCFRLLKSML
jgi:hypothetical protein